MYIVKAVYVKREICSTNNIVCISEAKKFMVDDGISTSWLVN